jgi:hypothetical protein
MWKQISSDLNNLLWDNVYTEVVGGLKRGDTPLGIYFLRSENSHISCNILLGISDHNGVLLEIERDEICRKTKIARIVSVYHKTDILGL